MPHASSPAAGAAALPTLGSVSPSLASRTSSSIEHLLCERLEPLDAGLQPLLRLGGRGSAEHVPRAQLPVPALKAFEVLLLLVELGGGELLRRDLVVDLGVELVALPDELVPFLLPAMEERRLDRRRHLLVPGAGIEDQRLAIGALHEFQHAFDGGVCGWVYRECPGALLQRYRAGTTELPPDRDAVAGWFLCHTVGHDRPLHVSHVTARW